MTGISRRCNGQVGTALCRCGSRPHRSGWARGPSSRSKVGPSVRSSLRCVTRRKTAVDEVPCGGRASSLSTSCRNDARVCPGLRLDKGASARCVSGRSCRRSCAGAQSDWPARSRASAGNHHRRSSRVAMKRRVHVHGGLGKLQRPLWGAQSDLRTDELKRRVTTATPVRSQMGARQGALTDQLRVDGA